MAQSSAKSVNASRKVLVISGCQRLDLESAVSLLCPRPDAKKGGFVTAKIRLVEANQGQREILLDDLRIEGEVAKPFLSLGSDGLKILEESWHRDPGALRVVASPAVSALDRKAASVSVKSQKSFVEKYQLVTKDDVTVEDPILGVYSEGLDLGVLSVLDEMPGVYLAIHYRYVKCRGRHQVLFDLPPIVNDAPITIPDLETDERIVTVRAPEKGCVLVFNEPLRSNARACVRVHRVG